MRVESKGAMGMLMVADGQAIWMYMPQLNKYTKFSVSEMASKYAGTSVPRAGAGAAQGFEGFGFGVASEYSNAAINAKEAKVLRSETLHANGADVPCWVVSVQYEGPGAEAIPQAANGVPRAKVDLRTSTLWIDQARYLVYKEISNVKSTLPGTSSPTETKHTVTFRDIAVDEPVADDAFVFTPPEGATEMDLSSFMPQSSPPKQ